MLARNLVGTSFFFFQELQSLPADLAQNQTAKADEMSGEILSKYFKASKLGKGS